MSVKLVELAPMLRKCKLSHNIAIRVLRGSSQIAVCGDGVLMSIETTEKVKL